MSDPEGLWPFSLRVYAAPGVAEWCLTQQDGFGADVNILLWAAWRGAGGRRLAPADLDAAEAATAPWRDGVVRPLRTVRRAMRGDLGAIGADAAAELRRRVKALELEAERLQQSALERLRPGGTVVDGAPRAPMVAGNLVLCLGRLGVAEAEPPPALIGAAVTGTCNTFL